ncbi:3-oxoacyl-[acyl-carrier-protein] reductase FabG [bioreactor metagenome]|uniref:3-oxoacyl-[acyl-carrier-protein] reductase FabG n=2 Tax=root TaxID=1 RepID=A0A645DNZ6_9ZZZZ
MFQKVMNQYGKCDVFINNAGIYPQAFLKDMSTKDFEKTISVNLKSVFICSKAAFNCMKDAGGVLIQAASYAALIPSAGSGAYAASKAAVVSLTKTMAAEFAPYGIRVNGFIPGVIATGMTQGVINEKSDELNQAIALHRLGEPEDVAKAVSFLASDESSYMTGTFIEVSGGKLCVQNPHAPWVKKGA